MPIIAICPVPPAFSGLPTRRFTWGMLLELMEVGACVHACMGNVRMHLIKLGNTYCNSLPGTQQGGCLTTSIMNQESQYSDAEAMSWCLDVARALDFMHSQRPIIVHRVRLCETRLPVL